MLPLTTAPADGRASIKSITPSVMSAMARVSVTLDRAVMKPGRVAEPGTRERDRSPVASLLGAVCAAKMMA